MHYSRSILAAFAFLALAGRVQAEIIVDSRSSTPSGSVAQVNPGTDFQDLFEITGSRVFIPNSITVDLLQGGVFPPLGNGPAEVPVARIYLADGPFGSAGTLLTSSTIATPSTAPNIDPTTYTFSGFAPALLSAGSYVFVLSNVGGPGYLLDVRIAQLPIVNTGTSGSVDDLQPTLWALDATAVAVPEPASFVMMGMGAIGVALMARRRRRS